MRTILTWKMLSDVSLYFSLCSAIPFLGTAFSAKNTLLLYCCAVAACGISSWICSKFREKIFLRIIFAILPFLVLLLSKNWAQFGVVAAPLLYNAIRILANQMDPDYWRMQLHVKFASFITVIAVIVVAAAGIDWIPVLGYGLFSIVLDVFALRQLRIGVGTDAKQKLFDFLTILAIPAGAGAIAGIIYLIFHYFEKVKNAVSDFLSAILYPFVWLYTWIIDLLSRIQKADPEPISLEPADYSTVSYQTAEIISIPESYEESTSGATIGREWDIALYVILGLIALAILALIIRKIRNPETQDIKDEPGLAEGVYEKDAQAQGKKARQASISFARRIRRIYAKYLRLINSRGFVRMKSHTSKEILDETETIAQPDASDKLRALYIRARYHPEEHFTEEDVIQAKKWYREIKDNPMTIHTQK